MRLLFIRHGEPDYARDCLTEHGREQAELLRKRLSPVSLAAAFTSPMGRAVETARICLKGRDVALIKQDWLHEFDVKVRDKDLPEPVMIWDICPKNWTAYPELYDKRLFHAHPDMEDTGIKERWNAVGKGLDDLLAQYGLVREGNVYRKQREFDGTIAFFCHFGASCVSIAHLIGMSPVAALQSFSAEPTAVATVCTDDRFGELVNFRIHSFGDISHLYDILKGQPEQLTAK